MAGFGKISLNIKNTCKSKKRTETGVLKDERTLWACHIRRKYSMDAFRQSVKVIFDINAIKLV